MNYENTTILKSDNLAEVQLSYKSKIKASDRVKLSSSKDAANALRNIFDPNTIEHKESAVILLLNRQNQILGWAQISTGGLSASIIDPKIVFQFALNANATAIILSHNHPSGNLQPSKSDIDLTKKIKEGGKILEIDILDHIILTQDSYYSISDNGHI